MSAEARRVSDAIRAVGGTAYLIRGDERLPFPASVQPRLTGGEPGSGPLGFGAESLHNLYAPADGNAALLAAGDTLEWQGAPFSVQSAEAYRLGEEALYYRAVIRKGAGV